MINPQTSIISNSGSETIGAKVSIIIPLRITANIFEAETRLERIIHTIPAELFDILIVDYGTPASHRGMLSGMVRPNVKIVRADTEGDIFNIGHARDIGVQHALTDVVMFHDIDFFCAASMYKKIYAEVIARQMRNNAYDFFCVPVFFLTEHGSSKCLQIIQDDEHADHLLHRHLFEATEKFVEFPAYGSSAIVVNKYHYLGIGGHSREFFGHGAEDYDLLHRLSTYYAKGPRTADYYQDTKSNQIHSYEGFRAYFALYGIDIFSKGIFFAHLWHPKRIIPGYHQSNRNFTLLKELMQKFDRSRSQPIPLGDLSRNSSALVLMKSDSAAFSAVRHALPLLGDFVVIPEEDFQNGDDLLRFVEKRRIDSVLLLTPYGNPHRLSLYWSLRQSGVKYFVFDRGALPDSWFFDPNGFNFDSISYAEKEWAQPLDLDADRQVEEYISALRTGEGTLEENGGRKSARYLQEHLAIGRRKVLFVPFQRPSDTVTTHFAGPAESVENFQSWVAQVAAALPRSEWVVICKNHPLDADLPRIEGVLYVEPTTHIHDLLELADKVLLMNSGVGVLAMAFNKPVICASNSFYCHAGICWAAASVEQALSLVQSDLRPSAERIKQFYFHLLSRIYSFGISEYRPTVAADGSRRRTVAHITFSSIKFPGRRPVNLGAAPRGVSLDAPIFQSFGGRAGIKAAIAKKVTIANAKPKSISTVIASTPQLLNRAPTRNVQSLALTPFQRKLRKLSRSPVQFFADYVKKRRVVN